MEGRMCHDGPRSSVRLTAVLATVLSVALCGCGEQQRADTVQEPDPRVDPALYAYLPPDQRQAVAHLLGCGARIDAHDERVTTVNLLNARIDDDDLAHLVHLPDIDILHLVGTPITDAGLRHVGQLTSLTELNISRTLITDAGLAHLEPLSQLKSLALAWTAITDAGLANLNALTSLEQLSLANTSVTDEGLARLDGLVRLLSLNTSGTGITFAGEVHLLSVVQGRDCTDTLRVVAQQIRFDDDGRPVRLDLSDDRIRDADLQCLRELDSLEVLSLNGRGLTDEALAHLNGLQSLRQLYVGTTGMTDQGLEKLQEMLPECVVQW